MPDLPARIAVTGSAGYLGGATVSALCARPEVELVAGIDLAPTELRPRQTRRLISITHDIRTSLLDVLRDLDIEAVVHLAFLLRPARDESLAADININATGRLLKDCEAAGVGQLIYLSSTTVYGAGPERNRPAVEEDPVNPVRGFQYSEHKAAAERLILDHSRRNPNMRACILRGCVTMAAGAENFITQAFARRVLPVPAGAESGDAVPAPGRLHVDRREGPDQAGKRHIQHRRQRHASMEGSGSNGRGHGPAAASADPGGVDWPYLAPGVAKLLETGRTEFHPVPVAGIDRKSPE